MLKGTLVFKTLILSAFLTLMIPAAAFAEKAEVHVVNVLGEAELIRESSPQMLKEGQALEIGDHIRTGDDGVVDVVWSNRTGYRVLGKSECRIIKLGGKVMHLEVLSGDVLLNVGRMKAGSDLQVHTPTAVASVRGTRFLTHVEKLLSSFALDKGLLDILEKLSNHVSKIGNNQAIDCPTGGGFDIRNLTGEEENLLEQTRNIPQSRRGPSGFKSVDEIEETFQAQGGRGEVDSSSIQRFDTPPSIQESDHNGEIPEGNPDNRDLSPT